jgi:hypothetical protein
MAKNMKLLQELDLLDRFLFAVAMEDPIIQKNILEILLEKQINLLQGIETEKEFRISPLLRSIRVDVYSKDDENNVYNEEKPLLSGIAGLIPARAWSKRL